MKESVEEPVETGRPVWVLPSFICPELWAVLAEDEVKQNLLFNQQTVVVLTRAVPFLATPPTSQQFAESSSVCL